MTEGEENIIIKGVLLEAISRDFSEELSNNKEVSVSPRFKRQMMAMMNNPNKWAERHKRDYRRRFVKVVVGYKCESVLYSKQRGGVFMKKRIIPLFFLVLLLATVMIPTSAAISTKAISGKPTLKIEGTTAYCVGKYNSGNRNDAISITVTLMQGSKEIASWSASGKGSVTISKTCKVETKKTYKLVLSATVNGVAKPDVSVTATAK